jgi:hypothetical protein
MRLLELAQRATQPDDPIEGLRAVSELRSGHHRQQRLTKGLGSARGAAPLLNGARNRGRGAPKQK